MGHRAAAIVTLVCAVGFVASVALGARATHVINFSTAPAAPRSAKSSFARNVLGAPKGLELAKLRRLGVEAFPGETMRLFAAPVAGGTFCFEWAYEVGAGSWIAEESGCSGVQARPLMSSYDDTRVSIVADRLLVDDVSVKLSNSQVVDPSLFWVTAPINAGFVLYQPPSGLHVVEVDALQHGKVVERDPIRPIP